MPLPRNVSARLRNGLAAWACVLAAGLAASLPVRAQDTAALRDKQTALREQLAHNGFGRPLAIESSEKSGSLQGDVYAVAPRPFAVVGTALQGMDHWCDILMLHLNVKDCGWQGSGSAGTLRVAVGRKVDQPVADAHEVDFAYRVAASSPDYLRVQLGADAGPLGTRDYRIVLEAIPVDAGRSFVHLSYSYGYGMAARVAMQGYLATLGRDKVGFSVVDYAKDGTPVYAGSMRGVIERNAMRYYLAIDAYLAALAAPPAEQPERRIREWIASVERYPRQLHEMERDEYLAMKRRELARQRAGAAAPAPG